LIDFYHSFGKKVIGIFHGVFLSCCFQNETIIYRSWQYFSKLDSFVHIIPDDYWVYKKFGFNNTIYIPNVYTFESKNTPSSPLKYKNLLMVGRVDDVIKGGKFGIYAMKEILNELPDAKLTIVAPYHSKFIINLIKELKIENSVQLVQFSEQISQFYLNASVLLVTSVSASFPMVMNEAKAYGLPLVSFDIDYSPCFQKGVITVDMFNYTLMGKEAAKLLKNYEYRKRVGREAKLSLNIFNNNDTILMWENLFNSLINGTEDYKKFQNEVEKEYYNEKLAKEHIEKHYKYGQKFNKRFSCHTFENITNLSYINSIGLC
jgi:glycosyltransferase involved in cell wall biosynthesis